MYTIREVKFLIRGIAIHALWFSLKEYIYIYTYGRLRKYWFIHVSYVLIWFSYTYVLAFLQDTMFTMFLYGRSSHFKYMEKHYSLVHQAALKFAALPLQGSLLCRKQISKGVPYFFDGS